MDEYGVEEQVATQIARCFKSEDDFVVVSVTNCGFVGLALAQRLYAPRLRFCMPAQGRSAILHTLTFPYELGNPPVEYIETLTTQSDLYDCVAKGKWCILMQPIQIDKFGNANVALVGDKTRPSRFFVGPRGMPDNTALGLRTYYIVTQHAPRVFVENVDYVCGVGYGVERKKGMLKWGAIDKVFSPLGVFDFEHETGRMRVNAIFKGVTLEEIRNNTGFELVVPKRDLAVDPPNNEELRLIRNEIDPLGVRRLDYVRGEAYNQVLTEIMQASSTRAPN